MRFKHGNLNHSAMAATELFYISKHIFIKWADGFYMVYIKQMLYMAMDLIFKNEEKKIQSDK
jgi:hypothetical protein